MIVFWREFYSSVLGNCSDWRAYKGRAKLKNGRMHIYPTAGTRKKLTEFIAFDDRHTPPRIVSEATRIAGRNVETLVGIGAIAADLPATYIDENGNIRRVDERLSLVLAGPEWTDAKEREFQLEITMPF